MRVHLLRIILNSLIIIPLIIGLFRFKKIRKSYNPFLFYLAASFIFETSTLFINNYFFLNLFQFFSFTIITVLALLILFEWGFLNEYLIRKKLLIVFFILTSVIAYIMQIGQKIQTPYAIMINLFIWILAAIHLLIVKLVNGANDKYRASKVLIILPIIISSIYYLVLQILMAFLFNAETKALFKELYYVLNYLNVFSYICFTIALLWAPNKEQFL